MGGVLGIYMGTGLQILEQLQHPNGLFSASRKDGVTGYNLCWIRDTVYASLGLEAAKNIGAVRKAYRALLDILLKHEGKIDWMIRQPLPKEAFRYIHARYHPETMEEIFGEWGNKQNDAVGAVLFKVGELERNGARILRGQDDKRILQKLVDYLAAIKYWQDADNGMWEENEEVHASSVGACVAGLLAVRGLVEVPEWLIERGTEALDALLPKESVTKDVDLALLSLIYPYAVVSEEQQAAIVTAVEAQLVRGRGVVRYAGDRYYSNGTEAEWCFGFPWLAIIYGMMGNSEKSAYYQRKTREVMTADGELPELYYGGTTTCNDNTPLGWGQSLALVADAQGVC